MSTKIEWTDETWNPVTGCAKVSQGCKHCYAERLWPKVSAAEAKREGRSERRPFTEVKCHPDRLDAPLKWTTPKRVFVNSMSDLFHEDVPHAFISDVFRKMELCASGEWPARSKHTFQVLTKRPARMLEFMQLYAHNQMGPPLNVWLGVSVEDQATADERIPLLLRTPAAVRFISAEPLLGPIDIYDFTANAPHGCKIDDAGACSWCGLAKLPDGMCAQDTTHIDWVIAGGESGPAARPAHPDWIRRLRDQCAEAKVAFFFKQWGEWAPTTAKGPKVWQHFVRKRARWTVDHFDVEPADAGWPDDDNLLFRLGKKNAGRELDGHTHDDFPA